MIGIAESSSRKCRQTQKDYYHKRRRNMDVQFRDVTNDDTATATPTQSP